MLEMNTMKKLTMYVNIALMSFVVMAMFFFQYYSVTYMVYHSIPTLFCYVVFFILINKGMLYQFARAVYIVITIYMVAGNICLGYHAGFHLYCISLVPLSFYMVYMAKKLNTQKINPLWVSFVLICIYISSSLYVFYKGPVYTIDSVATSTCFVVNAISVFCFLIGYAGFMLKLVMDSEDELTKMASTDRLTGLYNRHYMMDHLSAITQNDFSGRWVAMADIDDFKKINDTYGHSCGDYVLIEVAKLIQQICQDCIVCRWGGEEFLIISDIDDVKPDILEQLRQKIQNALFSYQNNDFKVTMTIGVSFYQPELPVDEWINNADDKMYEDKVTSKNKVVY